MDKKIISTNRKAFHNYEILDKLEAGVSLYGYEVKSVRRANVSLLDSFVRFNNDNAYLENVSIMPYTNISTHIQDYDARRSRILLLHKDEIKKLSLKVREKGLSVVPLDIYISARGKIKLTLGLAKGKRSFDKRETIKKKDIEREMERERY